MDLADERQIGEIALREIHKQLFIDDEWTERRSDGFAWIAHRLRQEITATEPYEDAGELISRIDIRIKLLEQVETPGESLFGLLSEMNRFAAFGNYALDSEGSLWSHQHNFVHAGTISWRPHMLSALGLLQLCLAERQLDAFAEMFRGRPAVAVHPESGLRTTPDDLLGTYETLFCAPPDAACRWAQEAEFTDLADSLRGSKLATLGGSAEGISIEAGVGNDTALIRLCTSESHPWMGPGMRASLHLPGRHPRDEAVFRARFFGRLEFCGQSNVPSFGAWCVDSHPERDTYVAYASFWPNALYKKGYIQDIAVQLAVRAFWVHSVLYPEVDPPNAWDVLLSRLRAADRSESDE
jgi:hypothetical protein